MLQEHVKSNRFRNFVTGACNLPQDWDSEQGKTQEKIWKPESKKESFDKKLDKAMLGYLGEEKEDYPVYDLGIGEGS